MDEPKRADRSDDLWALRNLIEEARIVVSTTDLPQGRGNRATELLESALALTDDLIAVPAKLADAPSAAAELGRRGGNATAKRGSEHYRAMAASRKNKRGGRPKSNA